MESLCECEQTNAQVNTAWDGHQEYSNRLYSGDNTESAPTSSADRNDQLWIQLHTNDTGNSIFQH